MLKKLLLPIIMCVCSTLQAQLITTFAGVNKHAFYNGAQATTAQFNSPYHLCIAPGGNVYICDIENNGVRNYNPTTKIITTFAGSGIRGYSGDGGTAITAKLNAPSAVAVDKAGNTYIAMFYSHVVRKVTPAGIITTFAGTGTAGDSGDGGPATLAQINYVKGIAVDAANNVYLCDQANDNIRKIDTAGIITTIAGTGATGYSGDGSAAVAASFNSPADIALDRAGNLYICDQSNNRIRKVNMSGIISTFAGTGSGGFAGDGGPATAAQIDNPASIAVDTANNIYFFDNLNYRVRKIAPSGIITTIAGNGTNNYFGDGGAATTAAMGFGGVTIDTPGNIYISDVINNVVRKVSTSGIITTIAGNKGYQGDGGFARSANISSPMGLCKDDAGNIYISDTGNHTVRRVNATGYITTVAGTGISGNSGDGAAANLATIMQPICVKVDHNGDMYIADYAASVVRKVNGTTGIISKFAGNGTLGFSGDGGPAQNAQLRNPVGIAIDSFGNVFISDQNNHVVRKVDAITHNISTYAGNNVAGYSGDDTAATNTSLNKPAYLDMDSHYNLYIADMMNNRIRKVDALTGKIYTVFGNGTGGSAGDGGTGIGAELCNPTGIVLDDSDGVSTTVCGKIRHVPAGGGPVSLEAGTADAGMCPDGSLPTSTVFNGLCGICYNSYGNMIIADAQNRCVRGKGLPPVGIATNVTNELKLKVFPNPNKGNFEITGKVSDIDARHGLTFSVINVLGEQVYQTTLYAQNNYVTSNVQLTSQLPAGLYYCLINGTNTHQSIAVFVEK